MSPLSHNEISRALRRVIERDATGFDSIDPAHLRLDRRARDGVARRLHRALSSGSYRPATAKLGRVSRPGKSDRLHAIATIGDGAILRAVASACEDAWTSLPACLIGGRPGGDARVIVKGVSEALIEPQEIIKFDISKAFATASFEQALDILGTLTARPHLLDLAREWAAKQGGKFPGLIEGSPLAPLQLAALLGMRVVPKLEPYAKHLWVWLDDGFLVAHDASAADEARAVLDDALNELGLSVSAAKTGRYSTTPDTSVTSKWNFLGFEFRGATPVPTADARAALVTLLDDAASDDDADETMAAVLRGWAACFGVSPAVEVFAALDGKIEHRYGGVGGTVPKLADLVMKEGCVSPEAVNASTVRRRRTRRPGASPSWWASWSSGGSGESEPNPRDTQGGRTPGGRRRRMSRRPSAVPSAFSTPVTPMNAQSFLKSVAKKLVAASKTLPAFQSPEVAKSMELVLFGLDRLQQALDAGTSDGPKPVARTLFFAPHVAAELVDPVLDGLKKQGKSYSAAAWTVFATYAAEYHPMNLTKLLKHIEDVLDVSLVAKSRKTGWPVYESQDFVDLRPMPVPFDAPATVDAADKGLG